MSDIMEATGLEKGGIYNHFESKEALALQAFDHAVSVCAERLRSALDAEQTCPDKLLGLIAYFASLVDNPPVEGGCPLLNSAIESDDAHPALRERVQGAMKRFMRLVEGIIQGGIEKGELKPGTSTRELAAFLIASLEGGLMLSKLYGDRKYLDSVVEHLSVAVRAQAIS